MKQVSTDTKCSSSEKSTKAANAPGTAPTGDSARPESPVILPGKLEHWNIDRLRPYERNPRTHSPEQITKIAASLLEFGWTNPILVDGEAGIIAGHGRLLAARELGMTTVPVIELTHLTEAQKRAYVIADNRLALDAGWDEDLLAEELKALEDLDFNLELTGFDLDELHDLLDDETVEDAPAPEPPEEPTSRPGDLWVLGNHRLLCGDSCDPESVDRLLCGQKIHLVNTDPPYNVKVEPRSNNAIAAGLSSFPPSTKSAVEASDAKGMHHQGFDLARHKTKSKPTGKMRPKDRPLANDFVSDEAFDEMLLAWFGNIARVLQPGHSFYIWGGYANCANYPPVLKACGLYFSQAVIWVKEHPVLTRKDFMGNHEWCQPAGTQVLTPDGSTAIENLRDGDRVVTFSRHHNAVLGRRRGFAVQVGTRRYEGEMFDVTVGSCTTRATDGHLWTARMTPEARGRWCVYLMRRGSWWRVGKSKLYTTWGFGPKQRLSKEEADEAWILSVHNSNVEATVAEQMITVRYGIPTTFWTPCASTKRTSSQIASMYDALDSNLLCASAFRALLDHHRRIEHPLLRREESREKVGARVPFIVRSCNLLPEVMAVPVPTLGLEFDWQPIDEVATERFDGEVYSLDVEKHHHYVADGIVTHNCFYGWREGAGHNFYGPTNAVDVWAVKKVNPQSMVHLTEKPVELAVRAIQYSSKPGQNVLDLFGGSGSTLIGADQTGRHAFLMELDPAYTDVIVMRWQEATGQKATLDGDGRTFDEIAADRRADRDE